MRRDIGKLVLGLTLLALGVAGCSQALPSQDPVTISFVHPEDPTGSYEQWAQQFHQQFPNVTVELSTDTSTTSEDAFVATQFELGQYLADRSVLDLSTFLEESQDVDAADFYPAVRDVFKSQGRQWALPFGIDMMMMYYNQDLFDQYGVAYPEIGWDWGDFLSHALDTTDVDAGIYGYALNYTSDLGVYEPVMFIYQHGGQIFDSLSAPTRMTLDDPLNIEAMDFYASLIHVHHVAPTEQEAQRLGRQYPWYAVFQGRFAMWSMLFSERGGTRWPSPWEMTWGVVPMPRDATAASLAIADGLFISADTEHPKEAWAWISFLSRQMPPLVMPARRSLAESQQFERTAGGAAAEAARAALSDAILVNPDLLGFDTGLSAMAEAFAQIRSGEITPEMALAAAQEKSGF